MFTITTKKSEPLITINGSDLTLSKTLFVEVPLYQYYIYMKYMFIFERNLLILQIHGFR